MVYDVSGAPRALGLLPWPGRSKAMMLRMESMWDLKMWWKALELLLLPWMRRRVGEGPVETVGERVR
jgi:hypothetical protein